MRKSISDWKKMSNTLLCYIFFREQNGKVNTPARAPKTTLCSQSSSRQNQTEIFLSCKHGTREWLSATHPAEEGILAAAKQLHANPKHHFYENSMYH